MLKNLTGFTLCVVGTDLLFKAPLAGPLRVDFHRTLRVPDGYRDRSHEIPSGAQSRVVVEI